MTKPLSPDEATVKNFSLLSPNKFKIVLSQFPHTQFWAQRVVLPTQTLGQNLVGTNTFIRWTTPGDTLEFDDLIISFLVDEDMIGYRRLKRWQEEIAGTETPQNRFSDMSIQLLTNNSNLNLSFSFKNTWPYLISTVMMDTTMDENQPMTVDVNFKHSHFTVLPDITEHDQ